MLRCSTFNNYAYTPALVLYYRYHRSYAAVLQQRNGMQHFLLAAYKVS
jgi:hypothetical protein